MSTPTEPVDDQHQPYVMTIHSHTGTTQWVPVSLWQHQQHLTRTLSDLLAQLHQVCIDHDLADDPQVTQIIATGQRTLQPFGLRITRLDETPTRFEALLAAGLGVDAANQADQSGLPLYLVDRDHDTVAAVGFGIQPDVGPTAVVAALEATWGNVLWNTIQAAFIRYGLSFDTLPDPGLVDPLLVEQVLHQLWRSNTDDDSGTATVEPELPTAAVSPDV